MKAINTSPFNNIIYPNFKAKNSLTEKDIYNKCHDKWINIKRADDNSKVIATEVILYIASFEFLFLQNPDEIIFDCDLLKNKSIHKQKQRGRFLKQLVDIYEIEYHSKYVYKGKVRRCVFSAKRTENSLKILENPKVFYEREVVKNDCITSQKSRGTQSNLTGPICRRTIDQVEEKDLKSLFSSTVNTTAGIKNARASKAANQNNTPVEPTQEPQKPISQVEIAPKLHEGLSPSQPDANQMALQQMKLFELKRKIAKTFGVQTAEELANKTSYIELTDHKLAVKLREGVKLTDYDKERLRNCIKAVYGENVEIVTSKPKVSQSATNCNQLKTTEEPKLDHTEDILSMVEIGSKTHRQNQVSTVRKNRTSKQEPKNKPENEEPMTLALAIPTEQIAAIIPYIPATPVWDKVRQALVNKHGSDLVNVRLKRLEITEQEGMITFTGPLSNTYLIANNFDLKLMECSELYGVVFKLIGRCRITGEIEERIIKFWPTTSQNERN
jgi:hypothetical protein